MLDIIICLDMNNTFLKTFFFLLSFQALKAFSDGLKSQTSEYSCSEGEKEVNRKKNRYKDILPCKLYSHTVG